MGFRGSRVQIPPSRFFKQLKDKQLETSPAPFIHRCEWGWCKMWCKIRGIAGENLVCLGRNSQRQPNAELAVHSRLGRGRALIPRRCAMTCWELGANASAPTSPLESPSRSDRALSDPADTVLSDAPQLVHCSLRSLKPGGASRVGTAFCTVRTSRFDRSSPTWTAYLTTGMD
jgi:hypothetical protein